MQPCKNDTVQQQSLTRFTASVVYISSERDVFICKAVMHISITMIKYIATDIFDTGISKLNGQLSG